MNNVFKAISDPTRRKILDLLKGGDMTAGDIAEHF
ncbi:sporulation delaying system autorepressor SdpR, partial [Enterococcus faecalis]